jgi:membrane-anchored protein YejM (alkaline phosphatase superfamily)
LVLFEALQKRSLLENTLIVITSDHGPRQNTQILSNYNVPLLFVSQNIKNQIVSDLASHLDFKDLLLSVLTDSDFKCNTEKIYTIGNSNELDYGMISDSNQYIFINNRSLTVKTNQNKQKVQQFNSDFQQYLNFFKTQKKQ